MRIIDPTGVPAEDRETFAIRPSVQAVRCDDGVEFVDGDGKTLDSYDGAHVVVIDGDNLTPIESDIFDALYTPATAAAPAPAPTPETAPGNVTELTGDTTTAAPDVNPPPETGSVTELTGDTDNDGDGPTPSVSGLK